MLLINKKQTKNPYHLKFWIYLAMNNLQKHIFFKKKISECFVCIFVYVAHACWVLTGVRRVCQVLSDWSCRSLWASVWMLGVELGFSERAVSVFNLWVLSSRWLWVMLVRASRGSQLSRGARFSHSYRVFHSQGWGYGSFLGSWSENVFLFQCRRSFSSCSSVFSILLFPYLEKNSPVLRENQFTVLSNVWLTPFNNSVSSILHFLLEAWTLQSSSYLW